MDLDAFSAAREPRWRRLAELTRTRRRTGAEVDEMTRLYRSAAADLSAVRSAAPEPALITRLSMLLASSRVWLTGSQGSTGGGFRRYFTRTLPAAMYLVRWWATGYALAVIVMGAASAVYALNTPGVLDLTASPAEREIIANETFASYYSEYDSGSFTSLVWTNNAWLSAQLFALGFTGFYPLFLGYVTAFQLGGAAAIMAEHDLLDVYFTLILPHGLLELSAVFLAGGAGLHMFWRLLVPGRDKTRVEALSDAFRILLAAILGVVMTLFVSAIIEGFITPSGIPWLLKDSVGVVALIAFWAYVFGAGRAAVRAGETGDVEAAFRVERAPVAS